MNQTQNRRWTQVLRKGKKFLFHFTSDTSRATVKRHAHHLIWKFSWKQKDYDLWQWKYWSCMNSNLMNAHKTNNPSHKYKMAHMTKLWINVLFFWNAVEKCSRRLTIISAPFNFEWIMISVIFNFIQIHIFYVYC